MPFGDGTGPFGQGPRGGFGRGRGRRMYQEQSGFTVQPRQDLTQPVSKEQELEVLKATSQQLKQRLERILRQIDELARKSEQEPQKFRNLKAFIDKSSCTACGVCANVCPQGAILINNVAKVNRALCTGCGVCIGACPNSAISLIER